MTPETRASLPGQFIALADGVTHYELAGPEDGPVGVLVNGFSIPLDALQSAGIRHALLSTLRDITGDPFTENQELENRGGPVELLWGDKDQTIPIKNAQKVLAAIPQAVFHPIPGAHHESCYEEPEVVNPLIIGFLQN